MEKKCAACGQEYNWVRSYCEKCNREYCLDCVNNHRAHPKTVWEVEFFNERGNQVGPGYFLASKIKPTRWAKHAYDGAGYAFTMKNTGMTEEEYNDYDWEQSQKIVVQA